METQESLYWQRAATLGDSCEWGLPKNVEDRGAVFILGVVLTLTLFVPELCITRKQILSYFA